MGFLGPWEEGGLGLGPGWGDLGGFGPGLFFWIGRYIMEEMEFNLWYEIKNNVLMRVIEYKLIATHSTTPEIAIKKVPTETGNTEHARLDKTVLDPRIALPIPPQNITHLTLKTLRDTGDRPLLAAPDQLGIGLRPRVYRLVCGRLYVAD